MTKRFRMQTLSGLAAVVLATTALGQGAPLPSWNAGAARTLVTDFVSRVTREGGPDYAPPAERVAAFDNDGTLWSEQPLYVQLAFTLDRVKALAPQLGMRADWRQVSAPAEEGESRK